MVRPLNPKPQTPNTQLSTLNPKPSTLSPKPSTLNPKPNPKPTPHTRFDTLLKELFTEVFKKKWDVVVPNEPVMFGDYLVPGADPTLYAEVTDLGLIEFN